MAGRISRTAPLHIHFISLPCLFSMGRNTDVGRHISTDAPDCDRRNCIADLWPQETARTWKRAGRWHSRFQIRNAGQGGFGGVSAYAENAGRRNMSLSEMLFLGLLGLVIFGPKRLAELSQQAGKTLARWKKISSEFQNQLTTEISGTTSNRPIPSATAETGTGRSGAIVSS